jgi:hypothetical protein
MQWGEWKITKNPAYQSGRVLNLSLGRFESLIGYFPR